MSHLERATIRLKKASNKFGPQHPRTITERLRVLDLKEKSNK